MAADGIIRHTEENVCETEFRSHSLGVSRGLVRLVGGGSCDHGCHLRRPSCCSPAAPYDVRTRVAMSRPVHPRIEPQPPSHAMGLVAMITPNHRDLSPAGTTASKPNAAPPGTDVAPAPGVSVLSEMRSGPELATRRILLVEDNDDARKVVSFRLKKMALVVTTAENGQEACELALNALDRRQAYDWILMDMQMPVVDGYEATRILRSRGYNHPIIAMTAYALDEDREECLRIGCNDYLTKPIDWNELVTILGAHVA
jgi:CheY-like chemotaxis protein